MAGSSTGKNILLVGLIGFIGYAVYATVNAFETMTFKIKNISFGNIVFGSPLPATITFTLTNSTPYPATINSIYGSVLINNLPVATLTNTAITQTTIPANGSADFPINFMVSASTALNQLINSLTNNNSITATFKGYVTVQGVTVPIPIDQSIAA